MSYIHRPSRDRVPSLTSLCQRVAAIHAESIVNLGSQFRFGLVRPILERCSPDQLMRLEETSPDLQAGTSGIWKDMCFQKYRMLAEEHYSLDDEPHEPDSWRKRFYFLQEAEMKRFEEVGSRIRSQRMEADERKKEREVRFTDRVPPPKRPRTGGWGTPAQPKTLFQKTRIDASKIQRAFSNSRSLPPHRQPGKTVRIHATPDPSILPGSSKSIPSRVTVNTVTVPRRVQSSVSSSTSSSSPASSSSRLPPKAFPSSSFDMQSKFTSALPNPRPSPTRPAPLKPPTPTNASTSVVKKPAPPLSRSSTAPPLKSPAPLKKDPMASLFVPKHRSHSQRPHS